MPMCLNNILNKKSYKFFNSDHFTRSLKTATLKMVRYESVKAKFISSRLCINEAAFVAQ